MKAVSRKFRLLTLAAMLYAIFPVSWFAQPFILNSNRSVCIFRTLTGRPCLFCGLSRAFAHAIHGDFNLAFSCHPLWFLAVFLIIGFASISLLDAIKGTNVLSRFGKLWRIPIWLVAAILSGATLLRWL